MCYEKEVVVVGVGGGVPVAAVRKSQIPGALDAHSVSAKTKIGAHLGTCAGDCTDMQTLGLEPSPFVALCKYSMFNLKSFKSLSFCKH